MKIENNDIIKLENNKDYIVVKRITTNNISYVYLMTTQKPIEIEILKSDFKDGEEVLSPILDKRELEDIIPLFEQ